MSLVSYVMLFTHLGPEVRNIDANVRAGLGWHECGARSS